MPFPINLSRLLSGLFPCEIAMRRSFCRSTRYPRAYGFTLYISYFCFNSIRVETV